MNDETLTLGFRGRVIDHLGIQMYQSPVAAVAELVSNAWDADAKKIEIILDDKQLDKNQWKIIVEDNGHGMTKKECQERFLNVGYDRRKGEATKSSETLQRPLMGRKGIGKFAGFGIAQIVTIETTSKHNGETIRFTLNIDVLREGDTYVNREPLNIPIERIHGISKQQGTKITLSNLTLERRIPPDSFKRSMALRFSVNEIADSFQILVNDSPLPDPRDLSNVEMAFPRDFKQAEIPDNCQIDSDDWGIETLPDGNKIRWKWYFYKNTIIHEELRGISIYSHNKLSQRSFMFNLAGGLTSQTGPEYLSGIVIADYLDEQNEDLISTERQRINWKHPTATHLETWGQSRIRKLLGLWKNRRTEEKERLLSDKIDQFSNRLDRLQKHEKNTVVKALRHLAGIEKLNKDQFISVSEAILTAWEDGKLRDLIHDLAEQPDMSQEKLLEILMESGVINALHTAEAVRMKVEVISGLQRRIDRQELENAVRDYIAENPWLVSPKWETFAVEKSIDNVMKNAAQASKLHKEADWQGRIDLAFSSGNQILILEFMRPGLKIDHDHLNRLEQYVLHIRESIDNHTTSPFKEVTGYMVADRITESGVISRKLQTMAQDNIFCSDWDGLLEQAKKQWKEFLDHIKKRSPKDERIEKL